MVNIKVLVANMTLRYDFSYTGRMDTCRCITNVIHYFLCIQCLVKSNGSTDEDRQSCEDTDRKLHPYQSAVHVCRRR